MSAPRPIGTDTPRHQKGAALAVGLMLLTILTLFGLVAVNGHLSQARTQANRADYLAARASAEAGLAWAERWLMKAEGSSVADRCDPVCGAADPFDPGQPEAWRTATLYGSEPLTGTTVEAWNGDTPAPRFYVEKINSEAVIHDSSHEANPAGTAPPNATVHFFRLRSGVLNPDGDIVTVLESIVAKAEAHQGPCPPEWRRAYHFGYDDDGAVNAVPNALGLPRCGRQAFRKLL